MRSTTAPTARARGGIRHPGFLVPLIVGGLALTAFLLVPFLSMARSSVRVQDGPWTGNYAKALSARYYSRPFVNSLIVAGLSTTVALALGAVAAGTLRSLPGTWRDRVLLAASVSSNFSGVPLAFGYIILLGANGMATLAFQRLGVPLFKDFDLYSWSGLSLVYVYFQSPLCVLLLLPAFEALRREWREAATMLGAGRAVYWLRIALPTLAPALAGTAGILFANALGAYATAYALVGSNYGLATIRIGGLVAGDVTLQPELGSALAVMLTALMVASLALNHGMQAIWKRRVGS